MAAAAASRSGDGVERFEDEEGADRCGLGSMVKAVSTPSPGAFASSAASAMLGIGGRTGAECETGDDGTLACVYDCAHSLDGLGEWFRPK